MIESNGIGARIRELRRIKDETQADLAKALIVKRETVNQWENGVSDLKTQYTVSLADHFETTCDYILRGIKPENIGVYQKTGLSDEAIENIKSINETVTDFDGVFKEGPIPTDISYTLELGIILNEILVSKELESLLLDIKELVYKQSVVEEIRKKVDNDKAKVVILSTKDSRIAEEAYRFDLWSTSNRAQEIIANVADRYYTKIKDGVKTYRATEILSNDGPKSYKMVQIVNRSLDEGDSDGQH